MVSTTFLTFFLCAGLNRLCVKVLGLSVVGTRRKGQSHSNLATTEIMMIKTSLTLVDAVLEHMNFDSIFLQEGPQEGVHRVQSKQINFPFVL